MTRAELEAMAEDWIRGTSAFETKKARIEAINMYVQAFLAGRDAAAELTKHKVDSLYRKIKTLGEELK